jgi:hypothetical protein
MKNLSKQIEQAGRALGFAVKEAVRNAEETIFEDFEKIAEEGQIDHKDLKNHFDFAQMPIQEDRQEGVLVHDAYIMGDKKTKKVLSAFILKVTHKPKGFDSEGAIVIAVNCTVEEASDSFAYPEDDDSLVKKGKK